MNIYDATIRTKSSTFLINWHNQYYTDSFHRKLVTWLYPLMAGWAERDISAHSILSSLDQLLRSVAETYPKKVPSSNDQFRRRLAIWVTNKILWAFAVLAFIRLISWIPVELAVTVTPDQQVFLDGWAFATMLVGASFIFINMFNYDMDMSLRDLAGRITTTLVFFAVVTGIASMMIAMLSRQSWVFVPQWIALVGLLAIGLPIFMLGVENAYYRRRHRRKIRQAVDLCLTAIRYVAEGRDATRLSEQFMADVIERHRWLKSQPNIRWTKEYPQLFTQNEFFFP